MKRKWSKTEVVLTIWRLYTAMWTETDIIEALWEQLGEAFFTPSRFDRMVKEMKIADDPIKFRRHMLHGLVGNWIIAAKVLGEFVQGQFLMNIAKQDKMLAFNEEIQLETSRMNICNLFLLRDDNVKYNKLLASLIKT